jgi:hypothetical protein
MKKLLISLGIMLQLSTAPSHAGIISFVKHQAQNVGNLAGQAANATGQFVVNEAKQVPDMVVGSLVAAKVVPIIVTGLLIL